MMEFCDRDTAVGLWKSGNNNIDEMIVGSIYMDILLPGVWTVVFEGLLDFCKRKKKEVLICGDTNAWSTLLGSREMNKKGEALNYLIFSKNLTIINKGAQPTFITCRAASTIDITMVMGETVNLVLNWRVHPDNFSSGHWLIKFGITISAQPSMFKKLEIGRLLYL